MRARNFKVLMAFARAVQNMKAVKVLEYWPYRAGRLAFPEHLQNATWEEKEQVEGYIDVWNGRDLDEYQCSRLVHMSDHLHRIVAKACGERPDNHTHGLIEYNGVRFAIRWSDGNTQIIMGGKVVVGSEYGTRDLHKTPV